MKLEPYDEHADPAEQAFWRWVSRVQETIRQTCFSPEFDINKTDLKFVEQLYYDELNPAQAADVIANEFNWS